jgi:hypothetical protein
MCRPPCLAKESGDGLGVVDRHRGSPGRLPLQYSCALAHSFVRGYLAAMLRSWSSIVM